MPGSTCALFLPRSLLAPDLTSAFHAGVLAAATPRNTPKRGTDNAG